MDIIQEFNKLAMLYARAFYDHDAILVIVIDALTRWKWVAEEVLADSLKLPFRQLQTALRFLVQEKLLCMEEHKTAKGPKAYDAGVAVAAANNNQRQGEDKIKLETHSHFCLDYAQMRDVVSYKLLRMRTFATDENWTASLEKMEVELKHLSYQLSRVKGLEAPDYGTLEQWELNSISHATHSSSGVFGPIVFGQKIDDEDWRCHRMRKRELAEEKWRCLLEMIEVPLAYEHLSSVEKAQLSEFGRTTLTRSMIKENMIEELKQRSKTERTFGGEMSLKDELPSTSRIPQQGADDGEEGDSEREETPTAGTATPPDPFPNLSRFHIYEAPVHAPEIKKVVALLWKTGRYFTAELIKGECGVDVEGNKALFDSLTSNRLVEYDQGVFSYKSKYNVRCRVELVQLIRRSPNGIPVADLKDEYPTAMEDLQDMKAISDIWLLRNIAYPRYNPVVPIITGVDDMLKKLFKYVALP